VVIDWETITGEGDSEELIMQATPFSDDKITVNKSVLHDFSLAARELLIREAQEHLESVYGLTPDGMFESLDRLPSVNADPYAAETRRQLEMFFTDEAGAGLTKKETYEKLTKEIAFTWLNRIVAFVMMERQGIIHHEAIGRGIESNGFKRWLAAPERASLLTLYDKGDLPKNVFGEGPRDQAYREFLLWQCSEVARELAVLFDTTTLASRILPRPRALHHLLSMVNAADIQQAWEAGNEETIGWIYQYFNEKEKAEVFERLYKKKQKIRPQDIPAATCLYTPRWIVKYLVHNTLGRQWMQMHPDSTLSASLDYLVPLKGEIPPVPIKQVREITLLDPACGTMHFGLVAFDLYVKMYEEELQKAGTHGWPSSPSVSSTDEIPTAILANNLHGIDIDLRAVQLSALTLFLKAKAYRKETKITQSNLTCADILPLDGEHLAAFLKETHLTDPLYERILRALVDQLKLAHHLGSLLKVEEEITRLIAEEKKQFEKVGRQVDLAGISVSGIGDDAFNEVFWVRLEDEIIDALNAFARRQRERGKDESYFVGETAKGIRLLDLLRQKYDVVVTNPPYMTKKNVNPIIAEYLEAVYPISKADLYTAFIDRCSGMLGTEGRLGMITQQSFMFVPTYEALRNQIVKNYVIESVAHVGPHAFEDIGGEKVNTTAFSICVKKDFLEFENATGIFIRIIKEPDYNKKRIIFEQVLSALRSKRPEVHVYYYRQKDFTAIPGNPWVYWINQKIKDLFIKFPSMKTISPSRQGLATGNNAQFIRYWWEVGSNNIEFLMTSIADINKSKKKWFPIMKGGEFLKWYGNREEIISFDSKSIEILSNQGNKLPSRQYYFRPGVTFPKLTSSLFNARICDGGFIFDGAGNCTFPNNKFQILAILNSKLSSYMLNLINPTVNFQVGDLARLPIPEESSPQLESLVEEAIILAKVDSAEEETTWDFTAPPFAPTINGMIALVQARHDQLKTVEYQIDEEVYRIYGIGGEDQAAIEVEVGPLPALPTPSREVIACRWIGYATGIIMGRFLPGSEGTLGSGIIDGKHIFPAQVELGLRDLAFQHPIGILDASDPDDLASRIIRALTLMLGEECTFEIITIIGGESDKPEGAIREYLKMEYWILHLQWYRKRPIYWLFQTPKKSWSLLLFHQRMTADTLYLLKGSRYLDTKMNATRQRIKELGQAIKTSEGRERKRFEKELADTEDLFADLEAFDKNLSAILEKTNERGEVVGWKPEFDDGVILNLAPMRDLIPSWKTEPEKYWKELESGACDWSYTAMRYWPDRVLEKCKTNKSFAIAHDQLNIYEGA
jgi:hypothetical protein